MDFKGKLNYKEMENTTKYSRAAFNGYTHRFIVNFKVDNDWRNDTKMDIYSNSGSFSELEAFIENKKSDRVKSFNILHRTTKESDDADVILIEDFLK